MVYIDYEIIELPIKCKISSTNNILNPYTRSKLNLEIKLECYWGSFPMLTSSQYQNREFQNGSQD
jgi:hypothetical protein